MDFSSFLQSLGMGPHLASSGASSGQPSTAPTSDTFNQQPYQSLYDQATTARQAAHAALQGQIGLQNQVAAIPNPSFRPQPLGTVDALVAGLSALANPYGAGQILNGYAQGRRVGDEQKFQSQLTQAQNQRAALQAQALGQGLESQFQNQSAGSYAQLAQQLAQQQLEHEKAQYGYLGKRDPAQIRAEASTSNAGLRADTQQYVADQRRQGVSQSNDTKQAIAAAKGVAGPIRFDPLEKARANTLSTLRALEQSAQNFPPGTPSEVVNRNQTTRAGLQSQIQQMDGWIDSMRQANGLPTIPQLVQNAMKQLAKPGVTLQQVANDFRRETGGRELSSYLNLNPRQGKG